MLGGKLFQTLSEKLEIFETRVEQHVKIAAVKHGDETGFCIAGKTHWLHTLSTLEVTFYKISEKRKNKIENLFGIFVHDHWKPYFKQVDV